jgi:hypothetical protein
VHSDEHIVLNGNRAMFTSQYVTLPDYGIQRMKVCIHNRSIGTNKHTIAYLDSLSRY